MQYSQRHMSTYTIQNLFELRQLIEKHDSWGLNLHEFQEKAGHRIEGNTEYLVTFTWGYRDTSLQEMWEMVQYIHKYAEGK
jgi:hypothetical protein